MSLQTQEEILADLFSYPAHDNIQHALRLISTRHIALAQGISDNRSLTLAASHLCHALNLDTRLVGEKGTILTFPCPSATPYALDLRATGGHYPDTDIYMHTSSVTIRFSLENADDLRRLARFVLSHVRRSQMRQGRFKPVPLKDGLLLDMLMHGTYHVRFAEASRAVARHCLLDAALELLTPFGLLPRELERKYVKVMGLQRPRKVNEVVPCVRIMRMIDYMTETFAEDIDSVYMSAVEMSKSADGKDARGLKALEASKSSKKDSSFEADLPGLQIEIQSSSPPGLDLATSRFHNPEQLRTSVLVTGLINSQSNPLTRDDHDRSVTTILRTTGCDSRYEPCDFPFNALVFNLKCHEDVVAFVKRILQKRDEVRSQEIPFEHRAHMCSVWRRQHMLGKQKESHEKKAEAGQDSRPQMTESLQEKNPRKWCAMRLVKELTGEGLQAWQEELAEHDETNHQSEK